MIYKIVFHPLLWLLVLTLTIAYAGGSRSISTVKTAWFTTSTTGDTARVVKITPVLAVMGFTYSDSVDYQADTSAHQTLEWTSPQQIMIWTPVADTQGTYKCSVVFQAQTLGFDLVLNEKDTTLATLIDTLVYLFNNTTNLKDTVLAEDSVTYLKLISKIGEGVLKGPWTAVFVITGGSAAMDTASAADSVTIAMVCDSMVVAHSDDVGVDSFMTAYDSTTFYIIQSDDPGVLFHDTNLNHADTHGTWAESQANVTSSSDLTDTLLNDKIWLADDQFRALGIHGDIVIDTSITDSANAIFGLGLADSASLWVRSYRDSGGIRIYRDLDSVHGSLSDGLPVTLHISRIPAWANDTVFFDGLVISWYISDTLSDTVVTRKYPIYIDLKLTEM